MGAGPGGHGCRQPRAARRRCGYDEAGRWEPAGRGAGPGRAVAGAARAGAGSGAPRGLRAPAAPAVAVETFISESS